MGLRGARERRVRTGGVELCVAELGDPARPTVVLVHGYPDSKEVWSEVAARLVAQDFHVVLYDIRGHGGSTAPRPLRGGFTLRKLTDDFVAVVDAVSPDRPVHLVGHDWGSVQSWEFVTVARTAGRIASFTSVSGPSLDHFGHWLARRRSRPTPRHLTQLLGQGVRSWYVYALHTPVLPELAWRGPLGRHWPKVLEHTEKVPPGDYPTASLPSDAAHGAWLYRDNIRARLTRPRADAHAHAPVQLVVPLGDKFLSPRLYDDLERWVPRLTRRTVDARHWLPRSRPDQLTAWIAEFVTRHEDDGKVDGEGGGAGVGPDPSALADDALPPKTVAPGTPQSARAPRAVQGSRAARAARQVRDPYAERFGGQLVLVTGAGGGIGRATALAFARAGARIVAVDRDPGTAARTALAAREAGAPGAWGETVDVGDERAMEKLAARVASDHGVVDILVNNAGIGLSGSFLDTTPGQWRELLDVNLWGVIHGCRLFGGQMAERGQGGHIVNVASAAAYLPSRALPAYSTSKAAVLTLSECLRVELAEREIGVSAICPGIVNTGITATTRFTGVSAEEEQRLQRASSRLYRLRNYPPEKVADAVLRAVLHDRAVVPVTPEARTARLLSRLAPGVLRALARRGPRL
ncbi:SDR family oxidoreductase [Streptomyces uncialis]|uniref:SDR family oxidoreductase n=1 Tax=Streptomyces uncialis TaxID=1048205 RepID=UPI002E368A11|nr:SDR family oxidoreductase [Streptomyces uncialis]